MKILVVRHGQSTWNAEQRWQGQADPPLSVLGERQARAAAHALAASSFVAVVSSDLERARRTAELLVPGMPVEGEPAWRERHAGTWTGLTRAEIDAAAPGAIGRTEWPPGFEGNDSVLERVLPALARLAAQISARSASGPSSAAAALVVTHGGIIRTLEAYLGADARAVPNLGGRWLEMGDDGPRLGEPELLVDPGSDVAVTVPAQL